jgi:hypothetical protein
MGRFDTNQSTARGSGMKTKMFLFDPPNNASIVNYNG